MRRTSEVRSMNKCRHYRRCPGSTLNCHDVPPRPVIICTVAAARTQAVFFTHTRLARKMTPWHPAAPPDPATHHSGHFSCPIIVRAGQTCAASARMRTVHCRIHCFASAFLAAHVRGVALCPLPSTLCLRLPGAWPGLRVGSATVCDDGARSRWCVRAARTGIHRKGCRALGPRPASLVVLGPGMCLGPSHARLGRPGDLTNANDGGSRPRH
ncbi:hypothetical protein BC628DRAFT_13969 [Trametes gibbosa]|nr:hypothetical protein BC628DRAFT_13969 [Trametes gibbosa]